MKNFLTTTVSKVRTQKERFGLALSVALMTLQSHSVFADDPFAKTEQLASQGTTKIQAIGVVTISFALVATGLAYAFGGREIKAAIKKHWLGIAIAIIAISVGPSFVQWFYNFVK